MINTIINVNIDDVGGRVFLREIESRDARKKNEYEVTIENAKTGYKALMWTGKNFKFAHKIIRRIINAQKV